MPRGPAHRLRSQRDHERAAGSTSTFKPIDASRSAAVPSALPFDPGNPPDEPPPEVVRPMTWRLALRLHRDHSPLPGIAPTGPNVCRACADPWPCSGRQIAVRGLLAAWRPGW